MKTPYHCLYNHELLILATSQTPYQSYQEPVTDRQTVGMVKEVEGTGVDALMICPQAWQTNLWISEVDRRWQDTAPQETEPPFGIDVKYFERAYYRMRRYMLEGKDPVGLTIATARACKLAPLFSYRMNEGHYTNDSLSPTHSNFWKTHPQYMLDPLGAPLNYLEPEVREYHRSLIFELLDRYDVDGFECDFLRAPRYFPKNRVEEGIPIMTDFVRSLREKLDDLGRKKGRRLYLGVRVAESPDAALRIGLDVAAWNREGLVDMVNVSFNPLCSQEGDVEGFRAILSDASLYGELNYTTGAGVAPGGTITNIRRRPSAEIYKTTALSFLERGADGVSLFNFGYWRDHSFGEPRRRYYPGTEPPFHVIADLLSRERLRDSSQHAVLVMNAGSLPRTVAGKTGTVFRVHLGECFRSGFFAGILRLEATDYISHLPLEVSINGISAMPLIYPGELFPSRSLEALPEREKIVHFSFNPANAHAGFNEITVNNHWRTSGGGHTRAEITFNRLELALYRTGDDFLAFLNPMSRAG